MGAVGGLGHLYLSPYSTLSTYHYHLSLITYHLSLPITYHLSLSPITYRLSPITYHLSLSPITYHLSRITLSPHHRAPSSFTHSAPMRDI